MNLRPTAKVTEGLSLDSFRANGWTDELLIEHGYAEVVPEAPAAQPAEPAAPAPVQAKSPEGFQYPQPVPNGLGVTNLADVRAVYDGFADLQFYPENRYSFAQHLLLTADALAKRAGGTA